MGTFGGLIPPGVSSRSPEGARKSNAESLKFIYVLWEKLSSMDAGALPHDSRRPPRPHTQLGPLPWHARGSPRIPQDSLKGPLRIPKGPPCPPRRPQEPPGDPQRPLNDSKRYPETLPESPRGDFVIYGKHCFSYGKPTFPRLGGRLGGPGGVWGGAQDCSGGLFTSTERPGSLLVTLRRCPLMGEGGSRDHRGITRILPGGSGGSPRTLWRPLWCSRVKYGIVQKLICFIG